MAQYTYQDFENAVSNAGLASQFSSYDLALAKANPDVGMGLLSAKQSWNTANKSGDTAGMSAANQRAEQLRSNAASTSGMTSYTGGSWGLEYNPIGGTVQSPDTQTSFTPQTQNATQSAYSLPSASTSSSYSLPSAPATSTAASALPSVPTTSSYSLPSVPATSSSASALPSVPTSTKYSADSLPDSPTWESKTYDDFDMSQFGEAPTYQSAYTDQINSALGNLGSYGAFTYDAAPTWESRHDDRIQSALNDVTDYGKFSYDYATDPVYQAYAKQYRREGDRSMQSTLANKAAQTGGVASSAAIAASQQAQNYYNAQLADKIPELYSQAYSRYLQDYSMQQDKLAALQNAEANDFSKYQTELSQYNTDRAQAFDVYQDAYNQLYNTYSALLTQDENAFSQSEAERAQWNADVDRAYQAYRDKISDSQWDQQMAYQAARDAYNDAYNKVTLGYSQEQDAFNNAYNLAQAQYNREQDAFTNAYNIAQAGYNREQDAYANAYNAANAMYNREQDAFNNQLTLAKLAAQYANSGASSGTVTAPSSSSAIYSANSSRSSKTGKKTGSSSGLGYDYDTADPTYTPYTPAADYTAAPSVTGTASTAPSSGYGTLGSAKGALLNRNVSLYDGTVKSGSGTALKNSTQTASRTSSDSSSKKATTIPVYTSSNSGTVADKVTADQLANMVYNGTAQRVKTTDSNGNTRYKYVQKNRKDSVSTLHTKD